MIKKRRSEIIVNGMKEKIDDEVLIEIEDKIKLESDGLDVKTFYIDDFNVLKKLLYNDIEYFKKWLKLDDIILLVDYVNDSVDEAITYIQHFVIGKGVNK